MNISIPIYRWRTLDLDARTRVLSRPVLRADEETKARVRSIIDTVKMGGSEALRTFTERFDQVRLNEFAVTPEEFTVARQKVTSTTWAAIEVAISQIKAFHAAGMDQPVCVQSIKGVVCRRESRPVACVGLYVPGGLAPLPSTALMLGIPALLAGCPRRIMCTPPQKDGSIDSHILAAAEAVGITEVYKLGGAQAIAAMAYGCGEIPKVDKIFGPGNAYVTAAKTQVALDPYGAACDMPAGPSEVMVLADHTAVASFVAADLLSQAEHGNDSHAVLITTDPGLSARVLNELRQQLDRLERRTIAGEALKHSVFIEATDMQEALAIANTYAAEHLIIASDDAWALSSGVTNAGSVFLGNLSPESMGDYASGTNHVLPTYGFSRTISGLGVQDFMKRITFQSISPEGMLTLGPVVQTLARLEGLGAHEHAVTLRLASLR